MRTDKSTRSSKVFAAGGTIANPFLLCRVAAVYARRLQKTRIQFAESINQSLSADFRPSARTHGYSQPSASAT